MANKVHIVQKLPKGGKVMISGELEAILKEYNIKAADLWKAFTDTRLCVEHIECSGKQITVAGAVPIQIASALCIESIKCVGRQIFVMTTPLADDICTCPEGDCSVMIRQFTEPGIILRDPPIYIPFAEIVKKIPRAQRKVYLQMMQEMMKD